MSFRFLKQYSIGLGLVLATWLIFFSPILSGQYVYFLDDLKIIYYPIETLYAQFQHNWELPVWANEFGFGQPLLAWGQLGFFTPLHLIMRALYIPPLVLLQASIVLYFLIGSAAMFIFLIRRNFHQAAAALGAIVFAYCGFNIGHLNHVNFYTSTMLLPLLLIALDALINKSTLGRATTLALVATAIAVSGQPQVVLYVYIVATVIGLAMFLRKWSYKALLLTVYAGMLAFLLSSFALLPLQEFLPQTERSSGLPREELFEFSYPPYNTITLILPYFFGNHENYSGPKGFQELAAFTGIIPLILASFALFKWKERRLERIAGITLVTVGILLALGKYFYVYTYLVENHFITSIGVVGRFVYFFDIGIVLLSCIGLQDLITNKSIAWQRKVLTSVAGYSTAALLIVLPFWLYASSEPSATVRFMDLFNVRTVSFWLISFGVLLPGVIMFTGFSHPKIKMLRIWILPACAAATFIFYGWNFNPRVPAHAAYLPSPFVQDLKEYREKTGLPARLYAAKHLPVTGNPGAERKLTDSVSPLLSIFQKLENRQNSTQCIIVPIHADSEEKTEMTVSLRSGLGGTIWQQQTVSSEEIFTHTKKQLCFPEVPVTERKNLFLSFESREDTNMKLFVSPSKSESTDVYFIRVQNPTPEQLLRSKKQFSIEYTSELLQTVDTESQLMVRHIQAIAGASSARWIGALSLKPYRSFVDSFFANDSDAFDGDGIHTLTRNRTLVDMSGVTHFTQLLEYGQTNDPMIESGYNVVDEIDTGESRMRLYTNPQAYPKAFIVPKGEFVAADDEVRFLLKNAPLDPRASIYVSGPTPPNILTNSPIPLTASATIQKYTNARVDIETNSNRDAFLVLTDSTSLQWQTFIDDKPVPLLRANSIFKAAQIPAGTHIVSFRYFSPAVHLSKILTTLGILIVIMSYGSHAFSEVAWSRVRSLLFHQRPRT